MKLSKSEFKSTAATPMRRLGADAEPPIDFWPYFESIPAADFEGHDCGEGSVTYVWEHPQQYFQHVLINTQDPNVFMALVLDLRQKTIMGHHLMDLNPAASAASETQPGPSAAA